MRRVKLVAVSGTLVLVAAVGAACSSSASGVDRVPAPGARPVLAAPLPPDPMLTRQACAAAAISTGSGARLFHVKMAVIERAAARDDTATLIAAANVIQQTFVGLAHGLAALAKKPLSPVVQTALSNVSDSMAEISSNTYVGSTADISERLTAMSATLAAACG